MSTTALFIELLLTGLQTAIWVTLLVLSLVGIEWINLERVKGFEAIIATLLLPVVYPLGVFVDYLAGQLFRPWELKIREGFGLGQTQTALKLLLQTKDQTLSNHFGYIRSRIRISRSSALNFVAITLASIIFTAARCRAFPKFPFWRVLMLEALLGALLFILAVLAWRQINRSFFKWVVRGYSFASGSAEQESIEESMFAAALSSSEKQNNV